MSERSKVYEEKMEKTMRNLDSELQSIRAGRANPHVLDKITGRRRRSTRSPTCRCPRRA